MARIPNMSPEEERAWTSMAQDKTLGKFLDGNAYGYKQELRKRARILASAE